jgi:transglutaminase/protease-like cytokinesis protein 3
MKIIILLFGLASYSLSSQNPIYAKIDQHVDTIKEDNFSRVSILAHQLVKPAINDTEKVRALFYWIASNIKYDSQGLYSKQWDEYGIDENTAAATFAWKKGICRGFAFLMKMMLDEIGLENELVYGHGKGEGLARDTLKINHVWNSVKFDGKWQLLDVTWANTEWSQRKVTDWFFLADPMQFVLTHYPNDSKWLLHPNPISYEEYKKLPLVGGNYFKLGFGVLTPKVEKFRDKVVFWLFIPADLQIGILLRNKETDDEMVFNHLEIKKEGAFSRVTFPISQKGKFEIEMTAIDAFYRKHFSILTVPYENN